MKRLSKKLLFLFFTAALMGLSAWFHFYGRVYFRASFDQSDNGPALIPTKQAVFAIDVSTESICDGLQSGDSREYRGHLVTHFAHYRYLFDGRSASRIPYSVVCSFPSDPEETYFYLLRIDLERIGTSYDAKVIWSGWAKVHNSL